jgi:hypothetical protein
MIKNLLGAGLCALPFCAGATTMPAAVGKPVLQAEALIQKRDYPAALQELQQAAAIPGLTPEEIAVIAQLRGSVAAGEGDYAQAAAAYQAALATNTLTAPARLQLLQAIAGFYDEAPDYPRTAAWVQRYIAAGGDDPRTRALLAQADYQTGDFSGAEQAGWREVSRLRAAGTAAPEGELLLLADSAVKAGDQAGYAAALQELLRNDPKPQYWNTAIALLVSSPDFSDALTLDVYRLRLATGTLDAPGAYEDYAERAILAGRPQEAKLVIDRGFGAGILTAATDSGHAQRLQVLAAQDAQSAATPDVAPDDDLESGIDEFDAGQTALAIANFQKVVVDAQSSARVTLARLWMIRVQNATAAK